MAILNPPKIIKIIIKLNPLGYNEAKRIGQRVMIYPKACYDVGEHEIISYYGPPVKTGKNSYMLAFIRTQEAFDKYIVDPDIEEITEVEANTILGPIKDTIEEHPAIVQAIGIKQQAGQTLTAEDLKALDINDPTPGIYKKKFDIKKFY